MSDNPSPAQKHRRLQIRDIQISQMPGFRDGLRVEGSFKPHINIITGPNASGKSSLARAMQAAVWQKPDNKTKLSAGITDGESEFRVELNYGSASVQQNGNPGELPVEGGDNQPRYLLALHEMAMADDSDIADRIHTQLSGGINLEAAGNKLGFNDKSTTTRIQPYQNWLEANREVSAKADAQKEVSTKQSRLESIRKELKEKENELSKRRLVELALELNEARQKLEQASDQLKLYDPSLANLRKDDAENLEKYRSEWAGHRKNISKAEEEIRRLKEDLAQLNLPESDLPEADKKDTDDHLRRLEQLENETRNARRRETDAQIERASAAKQLGLRDEGLSRNNWSPESVSDSEAAWQQFFEAHARVTHLKGEINQLENKMKQMSSELPADSELTQGLSLLGNWLKAENTVSSSGEIPSLLWILLSAAAISIIAAHWFPVVIWAGLLFVMVAVVMLVQSRGKKPSDHGKTHVYEDDYRRLKLAVPAQWSAPEVASSLAQLAELLQQSTERKSLQDRIQSLNQQLHTSESDCEAQRSKWAAALHTLGVQTEPDASPSSLFWLFKHAIAWHQSCDKLEAAGKELQNLKSEVSETLQAINARFAKWKVLPATDHVSAKSTWDGLLSKFNRYAGLISEMAQNQRALEFEKERSEELKNRIAKIFERAQLNESEEHELRRRLTQLAEYEKVKMDVNRAQLHLENTKSRFNSTAQSQSEANVIETLTYDELLLWQNRFHGLEAETSALREQIVEINTLVSESLRSTDLEKLLAKQDDALQNLEAHFEENIAQRTGHLWLQTIRSAYQSGIESKLLQRADSLFQTITKQRYSLRLGNEADKSFRAYDEVNKTGHALNELSTGTRIQLLLAVRLAYIETQERNYRFPLFADELLGNSDDVRAEAIMDALVQIARTGRQVFYFTAQMDEVGKWQRHLSDHDDVEHVVVSLEGGTGQAADIPEQAPEIDLPSIPSPQGHDHQSYGRAIKVPRFDLRRDNLERLHIWYLMDDPNTMYQCLQYQLRSWGQFRFLKDKPPHFAGPDWPMRYELWQKRASLIEKWQILHNQGRPKHIDREVLQESGAFSPTFIDKASVLLDDLRGDTADFLARIELGELKGFRDANKVQLREYLTDNGFLNQGQAVHSEERILDELYAMASNMNLPPQEVLVVMNRIQTANT